MPFKLYKKEGSTGQKQKERGKTVHFLYKPEYGQSHFLSLLVRAQAEKMCEKNTSCLQNFGNSVNGTIIPI